MKSLDEKILEFGHLLRRYGVNVTHSQIGDALESIVLVGTDSSGFETALSCTLIKDIADLPVFEDLFRQYFGVDSSTEGPQEEETPGQGEHEEETLQPDEDTAREEDEDAEDDLRHQPLVRAVRAGDYLLLHRIGMSAVDSLGALRSRDVFRLPELLRQAKKGIGWQRAWDILCAAGPDGKDDV